MESEIKQFFKGDISSDPETLDLYSHDASLCEVKPALVVFPKDSEDISNLVSFVSKKKASDPSISLTARAAGTCMSGGSLNSSIIMDVSRYMKGDPEIIHKSATVLPGTLYRDFEKVTLSRNLILPCYTASKNICALGGMIANNCAGEKTLRYGKIEKYVESLFVVLADGKEYEIKPLSKTQFEMKRSLQTFEGELYSRIWDIIQNNKELISKERPQVSKNSAGYAIWNVWDEEKQVFDLTQLIVGSQGTLGMVTKATLRLVPVKKLSKLMVVFMKDIRNVSELVNTILTFNPESLESYDDSTMGLAVRFLPEMLKSMKTASILKLGFSFLPEVGMVLTGGIPKLILLVEFSGDSEAEIDRKMETLSRAIRPFPVKSRLTKTVQEAEKYWTIRRESFNLLRKHVHGRRTAPFIDDVIVLPKYLPEFLPKMRSILDAHDMIYTIAGHAGNGNFHIIPLIDMNKKESADLIMSVSDEVYDLVASYGGSITAEHNDGIIRTPYLSKMFSEEMIAIFREIKEVFDPKGIFNPGKKVNGTKEYLKEHLVKKS